IDAFLNATPRQGTETLANWGDFRPAHNKGEGNEDVRLIASSTNLNFRSGPGSCVIDDYTTSKARYREIACLVDGPTSSAVIVAAAPTALWDQQAVTLERAVASVVPGWGAAPNTAIRPPIIEPRNPHDRHSRDHS